MSVRALDHREIASRSSFSYESGERYFIADVEQRTEDFDTYGLKVAYDFPGISLTSATSYLDFFSDNHLDQAVVAGVTHSFAQTTLPAKTFAQEVNLASTHDEPWRKF